MTPAEAFRAARDALLAAPDLATARATFRWPAPGRFNWVDDWFEPYARGNRRDALRIVGRARDERGPAEFWADELHS